MKRKSRVRRAGRIWISGENGKLTRYVREKLFVAHRWRDRLALLGGALPFDEVPPSGGPTGPGESLSLVERALDAYLEAAGSRASEWIAVGDHAWESRNQVVLFVFGPETARPVGVVKVRAGSDRGESLIVERNALVRLAATSLRDAVPAVTGYQLYEDLEMLILQPRDGVSMYVEMNNALRPAHLVSRHFAMARQWLTAFQSALPGSAHGDFWGRNILVASGDAIVVDWENFSSSADPLADVFHFPLTYGQTFRWYVFRGATALECFRKTFLDVNVVSSLVKDWFRHFAQLHKYSVGELREAFIGHLAAGAAGRRVRPRLPLDTWNEMQRLLASAESSVFSG